MEDNEKKLPDEQWLRLMIVAGEIGPGGLQVLLDAFGSVEEIFDAGRRACASLIGEAASSALFADEGKAQAGVALEWLQTTPQADVISWADWDFPKEAIAFSGAPSLFFIRGRRELLQSRRIALTGVRQPDEEGLRNAGAFASALVHAGRSVVTFLEDETDAAVTRSILSADSYGNAGLIVLSATGPDRLYPSAMRELYHRVAQQGLVISPFIPGTAVSKLTLEHRQIICAYLCPKLLVVQSELSGKAHALARLFAESSRDVFVIPGSIHSALYKGSHKLLKEGARLTETVADITQFGSVSV